MRKQGMRVVVVALLSTCAPIVLAAPQQTSRPGEATKAEVWIQNRSEAEAIPVTLSATSLKVPLAVDVITVPNIVLASTSLTQVRVSRQAWEYRQMVLAKGQDAADLLTTAGQDSWELTGVTIDTASGPAVILKRPR